MYAARLICRYVKNIEANFQEWMANSLKTDAKVRSWYKLYQNAGFMFYKFRFYETFYIMICAGIKCRLCDLRCGIVNRSE